MVKNNYSEYIITVLMFNKGVLQDLYISNYYKTYF